MQQDTTAATGGIPTEETDRLIASDKIVGTAVYNRAGEHLGSVHSLMIDKHGGRVDYAVMSFGGFLGVGESYHPLPWKMLSYDGARRAYVVDLGRDQIRQAPRYTSSNLPNWAAQDFSRGIDGYYAPLMR